MLAAMPDIEAMELVDRFFEVGAEAVGTPHPIGIFLAGCRECLGLEGRNGRSGESARVGPTPRWPKHSSYAGDEVGINHGQGLDHAGGMQLAHMHGPRLRWS